MKRTLLSIVVGAVLLSPGLAQGEANGWFPPWMTISESMTWAFDDTGTPSGQETDTLAIWMAMAAWDGSAAAEFSLEGTLQVLSVIPEPGVLNSGTATSPFLESDTGCFRNQTMLLAKVVVADTSGAGGTLCIVESANGRACMDSCLPGPDWWTMRVTGFASDGSTPCWIEDTPSPHCDTYVSVDGSSWGSIKSVYR
jgi:hypothetical protein